MEYETTNGYEDIPEPPKKPKIVFHINIIDFSLIILIILSSFSLGANVQKNMFRNPSHLWLRELKSVDKQIQDRITEDAVIHHGDWLEIVGDFRLGNYQNTDSMLPLIDEGSLGIYVLLDENVTLHLGDVISYEHGNSSITHRIVRISQDEKGFLYTIKGDNNIAEDPFKIRRENITAVMVGILW